MIIVKNIDNLLAVGDYQSFTFNFEFDNASTLPIKTYQLGLSTYIISDGSTAKNIVNNNTYVYQKGNWVKTFNSDDKETKSDYIINNPYMGYINIGASDSPSEGVNYQVDFTKDTDGWTFDGNTVEPSVDGVLITHNDSNTIQGNLGTTAIAGDYEITILVKAISSKVSYRDATFFIGDNKMVINDEPIPSGEYVAIKAVGILPSDLENAPMHLDFDGLSGDVYIQSIAVVSRDEKTYSHNMSISLVESASNWKDMGKSGDTTCVSDGDNGICPVIRGSAGNFEIATKEKYSVVAGEYRVTVVVGGKEESALGQNMYFAMSGDSTFYVPYFPAVEIPANDFITISQLLVIEDDFVAELAIGGVEFDSEIYIKSITISSDSELIPAN